MKKILPILEIVLIAVSTLYTVCCVFFGSPNHDVVCMGNMILGAILTGTNCLIIVINERFYDYLELKHVEIAWKREKLEDEQNG